MLQTEAEKYNTGCDTELNIDKVRWSCRRGMLELDHILIPFCDEVFASLATDKQLNFVRLLQATDQDLYNWLLGTDLPEQPELQDLAMVLRYLAKKRIKEGACAE